MASETLKLVTSSDEVAGRVRDTLKKLTEMADQEDFVGLACVIVRKDGSIFVTRQSNGKRVLLLGAVTDLQFVLANDGNG